MSRFAVVTIPLLCLAVVTNSLSVPTPSVPDELISDGNQAVVSPVLAPLAAPISVPPPTFTVDLHLAPRMRWNGAARAIVSLIGQQLARESLISIFSSHNASLFDRLPEGTFERLHASMARHYPSMLEELEGLCEGYAEEGLGDLVSVPYMVAWVWFHELAHTDVSAVSTTNQMRECTGIVIQAKEEGSHPVHVRNMDQSPSEVRFLTLQTHWIGGHKAKEAAIGVDWYTSLTAGFMTGVRKGVAALEENWRFTKAISVEDVVRAAERGVLPQIWLFRSALVGLGQQNEEMKFSPADNFHAVLRRIEQTEFAAGMYVIASGGEKGDVADIARLQVGADGISRLGNETGGMAWFIAQTNYDVWRKDPSSDPRRSAAQMFLERTKQPLTIADAAARGLFAVSSPPVLNGDTAYTTIMEAKDGTMQAIIRWPQDTETPFMSG